MTKSIARSKNRLENIHPEFDRGFPSAWREESHRFCFLFYDLSLLLQKFSLREGKGTNARTLAAMASVKIRAAKNWTKMAQEADGYTADEPTGTHCGAHAELHPRGGIRSPPEVDEKKLR